MNKEQRKIEINAICKINRALALELKGNIFEQIVKETVQEAINYAHSCEKLNAFLKIGDKVIYSSCVKAEVIEVITNDYIKIKDEYGITFYTNIDVLELDTESV